MIHREYTAQQVFSVWNYFSPSCCEGETCYEVDSKSTAMGVFGRKGERESCIHVFEMNFFEKERISCVAQRMPQFHIDHDEKMTIFNFIASFRELVTNHLCSFDIKCPRCSITQAHALKHHRSGVTDLHVLELYFHESMQLCWLLSLEDPFLWRPLWEQPGKQERKCSKRCLEKHFWLTLIAYTDIYTDV